jgi:hypothetical protein
MSTSASSPGHAAPPSAAVVVAEGPINNLAAEAGDYSHVFQFSSDLALCGKKVGAFLNNVRCRKWTDLSGNAGNTCALFFPEPAQPDPGSLVAVGDVTLKIDPQAPPSAPPAGTIVCPNFRFDATQTHGTQNGLTLFLLTGFGTTANGRGVTGVGRVLEQLNLDPPKAPTPVSWHFVFTLC